MHHAFNKSQVSAPVAPEVA